MHSYTYRQKSGQGCLAACLAYLYGIKPDSSYEHYMVRAGLFGFRDNFAINMTIAFLARYRQAGKGLRLGFAHKRYAKLLQSKISRSGMVIEPCNTQVWLQGKMSYPFVLYVDRYALGAEYHYPHFILVLTATEKMLMIYDPWEGKCRRIQRTKITKAVQLLRAHLRVCSVVISVVH